MGILSLYQLKVMSGKFDKVITFQLFRSEF